MNGRAITVCYFGTYREEYSRNQIMLQGLRASGVTVLECHERLWAGIEDRVQTVKGGWKSPGFWFRLVRVYSRLLKKYFAIKDYDVLMVGYPGHLDVVLARLLAWFKHKPLVWDIFMSVYLISVERGLNRKNRLPVTLLRYLEKIACTLPDLLILDTADYVEWFHHMYGISTDRFRLVPTGADNHIFSILPAHKEPAGPFRVVYYGTFIPNHGVSKIVLAAAQLKENTDIIFDFIGTGPEREEAERITQREGLENVRFIDWLSKEDLVCHMRMAAICLGAFGDTPQSLMTVQNKIYEGLAMGKVVLTGESPAVNRAFRHKGELYTCPRRPEDIANAILELYADPDLCRRLAMTGRSVYEASYTIEKLGLLCQDHLYRLLCDKVV